MNARTRISGKASGRTSQVGNAQQMNTLLRCLDDDIMEQITMALIDTACEGNVSAAKLLLEYKYGKVPDRVEDKTDTIIRVEYA